jgi:hypothetical protein
MAGHLQGAAVRDARDGEKAEGCGWDTDRSNEAEAAIAAADAGLRIPMMPPGYSNPNPPTVLI